MKTNKTVCSTGKSVVPYGPGFDSGAKLVCFFQFIYLMLKLYFLLDCEKVKINKKFVAKFQFLKDIRST